MITRLPVTLSLVAAATLLLLLAPAPAQAQDPDYRKAAAGLVDAFNSGDPAKVVALTADNATLQLPDGQLATGADEIRAAIHNLHLNGTSVRIDGDVTASGSGWSCTCTVSGVMFSDLGLPSGQITLRTARDGESRRYTSIVLTFTEETSAAIDAARETRRNVEAARMLIGLLLDGKLDAATAKDKFAADSFRNLTPGPVGDTGFIAWANDVLVARELSNVTHEFAFVQPAGADRVVLQGTIRGESSGRGGATVHTGVFIESFRFERGVITERAGNWRITPDVPQKPIIPEWVLALPSQPGKAFFGAGADRYRDPAAMERATRGADMQARRMVADLMKTVLASAVGKYLSDIGVAANERDAAVREITQGATNMVLMGCAVVKRQLATDRASGMTQVFSLARLSFGSAAATLRAEATKVINKLKPGHTLDGPKLDKFLEAAQTEMLPESAAPSDLPPIEDDNK